MTQPGFSGRCAAASGAAGGDVRRDVERHLVALWNDLRILAGYVRAKLGVDPVLLHLPVLGDEQPERSDGGRDRRPGG